MPVTIINSFVQGDCAYLLTDTAWVHNRTGKVVLDACKILRGLSFPWAIAVTGDAYLAQLAVQLNWRAPKTVSELLEAAPLAVRGTKALSVRSDFDMDLRIAVWCADSGMPRVYHLGTDPHRCALWGIEPWQVVEAHVIIPGDTGLAESIPDVDLPGVSDPSRFDAVRDGLRLITAQRETIVQPAKYGSVPLSVIGCSAELVSITPNGVEVKTLHRWEEDQVGQLIRPRPTLSPRRPLAA